MESLPIAVEKEISAALVTSFPIENHFDVAIARPLNATIVIHH